MKVVEIIENVSDIATVDYKVNFATVGKTMGKMIPVITKAIKTGNMEFKDGKYFVHGETELVLEKEDILVSYIAKDNKPVLSDESVVVSLDLTITDELKAEGLAREIVRNIQDGRKGLGLEISDRIRVEIQSDLTDE